MQPLRYGWLWLGAGLTAIVVILGLALVPMAAPIPVAEGDKITHILAFAFLTTWFLGVFQPALTLRVAVLLTAYGFLIEFLQSFVPYRSSDPYDVLSDVIGIGAGWLLAAAGLHRWCGRLETLLGVSRP